MRHYRDGAAEIDLGGCTRLPKLIVIARFWGTAEVYCGPPLTNSTQDEVRRPAPLLRLRSSGVGVAVMVRCPVGLLIPLDGGDLDLEITLDRWAPKWGARHIDSVVLTF